MKKLQTSYQILSLKSTVTGQLLDKLSDIKAFEKGFNAGWTINAIQRLSDVEVFTLGDTVRGFVNDPRKIQSIKIINGEVVLFMQANLDIEGDGWYNRVLLRNAKMVTRNTPIVQDKSATKPEVIGDFKILERNEKKQVVKVKRCSDGAIFSSGMYFKEGRPLFTDGKAGKIFQILQFKIDTSILKIEFQIVGKKTVYLIHIDAVQKIAILRPNSILVKAALLASKPEAAALPKQEESVKPWEVTGLSYLGRIYSWRDGKDGQQYYCEGDGFIRKITFETNGLQGITIYQVKRLSDSEVFTVGDKIIADCNTFRNGVNQNHLPYIIVDEISITGENLFVGGYNIRICSHYKEPVKKPLFKTEDGVDIYEGDKYYYTSGWDAIETSAKPSPPPVVNSYKRFSTEAKAKEYIRDNKPLFSVNDIRKYAGLHLGYGEKIIGDFKNEAEKRLK